MIKEMRVTTFTTKSDTRYIQIVTPLGETIFIVAKDNSLHEFSANAFGKILINDIKHCEIVFQSGREL